jgi:hypothetical protein
MCHHLPYWLQGHKKSKTCIGSSNVFIGLLHIEKNNIKKECWPSLEESLSITTGCYDLAIATHARKMHKNLFVVVHPEVLDND